MKRPNSTAGKLLNVKFNSFQSAFCCAVEDSTALYMFSDEQKRTAKQS